MERRACLVAADLQNVASREQLITLLERVVDELYDPHAFDNVPIADAVEARLGRSYAHSNASVVAAFDRAVERFRQTVGLIADLWNTPSGGTSNVARGILGRFVTREQAYRKHVLPAEERDTGVRRSWLEIISPRGPVYSRPVVVLVGRWTGSMGEGLAIGFDATGAGTVVGTAMAGLVGATMRVMLPRTPHRRGCSAPEISGITYQPPTTTYQLPTTNHQPPTTNYQLISGRIASLKESQ